ncbi:MAG: DNA polymerase/3'-5' exonuclease PolX [Vicinamibacterales bacterium]
MSNDEIARILLEIADLLELRGENVFKVRAYRSAGELVATYPEPLAKMDVRALRALPGVGKDLSARIREMVETGACAYHAELSSEFPTTLLPLLRLQGVGARTAALLYRALGIRSLEDLEAAALAGRLRAVRGFGSRKEAQILRALEEIKLHQGRTLLAEAEQSAAAIVAALSVRAPGVELLTAGSARRGAETCGDLDLLAIGGGAGVMEAFTSLPWAERILGRGETKSSIRLANGMQADLRLVPPESRGAALQYFTGSKAHNIALRDRALARGLTLNEYGLYRLDDDAQIAGADERELYERLGLAWIPPELRENRGEIEAAEARLLPRLIEREDLAGDLHSHTVSSDGRNDLQEMAVAARAAGLSYLAITDHSKSLAMARGLDERAVSEQTRRIRELNARLDGITLLAGIECDILPDGSLDLAESCLAELDIVVASIHSAFSLDEIQMTERMLRAIESPVVHVIGHPTGRLLLRREGYAVRLDQVLAHAAAHGVALEINGQADRRDLNEMAARRARDRGVKLVVSSDAHSTNSLSLVRWGVLTARRAWLEPKDVLNTLALPELMGRLRKR